MLVSLRFAFAFDSRSSGLFFVFRGSSEHRKGISLGYGPPGRGYYERTEVLPPHASLGRTELVRVMELLSASPSKDRRHSAHGISQLGYVVVSLSQSGSAGSLQPELF